MTKPTLHYRTGFLPPVADIIRVLEGSGIVRPTHDVARID